MNSILTSERLLIVRNSNAGRRLELLKEALAADSIIPYLGPGLLLLNSAEPTIPHTPEAVAAALNRRALAPSRIRTNMWSVAQFIEQRRHRRTLQTWMAELFAAPAAPTALHTWLATLPLSVIIDSWYDGTMRAAVAETGRTDVVEIQGVSRANEIGDIWTKAYDLSGREVELGSTAKTVLYTPHGSVRPAANFLVSDSDYVEVLTEIDIQTPIPEVVKDRRTSRGLFFLGCRFNDQMLRIYARQIMKRSSGPRFAVLDAAALTNNERRFLAASAITLIDMPTGEAAARLVG
ncbi:SIR2 family NAD-dependent protein deacylase [Sinorhizobium prairiense]|uniref:SIR2 family NAD-dependent protein deacylase n=1 Tax=unclassified Sinorhizobium TaxID=2613772 RepID=UPI0023D83B3F|nr:MULTISPECIES: SIR2 family protein [unclassified Sinorhizobium]WEJ08525.1 SIR2 family protein [Sinorhizobium sp. M103]WEJ13974.1 SIR2 family protein [Sinorhizobium sp. K101]WEJ35574.1 SIR2 family protein [Sinorhizobium sp. C101]